MPHWSDLVGLNAGEVRKARQEAGVFLGTDPPIWNDFGSDGQGQQGAKSHPIP